MGPQRKRLHVFTGIQVNQGYAYDRPTIVTNPHKINCNATKESFKITISELTKEYVKNMK